MFSGTLMLICGTLICSFDLFVCLFPVAELARIINASFNFHDMHSSISSQYSPEDRFLTPPKFIAFYLNTDLTSYYAELIYSEPRV